MSKERLEEMNNKVTGLTDGDGDFADAVKMKIDVYAWFYEHAERVQELEEDKKALGDLIEETAKTAWDIEQQNKRYREALEFYADRNKYDYDVDWNGGMSFITSDILDDEGETANEALESESE